MKILSASHILPVSSGPIENGAVAIDDGKIAAVGNGSEILLQFPNAEREEFGEAAIVPGFVNCHSHLELTHLRGALDDVEHDFSSWLLRINELRAAWTDDDIIVSAVHGAREGAAAGVTTFGDIGRFGFAGLAALKEVGLRGVVFQETEFSPDNRTANDDFAKLAGKFEKLHLEQTDLVRLGLSPHSPYTVGSQLFELLAQYSIINRVPLHIHAAESADEAEMLTKGTGLFSRFYERMELEWHSPHCSPIEYLERLGVLSARPLLAHCIRVSDSDIAKITGNGIAVAHCPKSNAKFGHGAAPFEKLIDAGVTVGLGSDSVASNNVCDPLEEARFAALTARNRDDSARFVSADEVLHAATLGGAKALGLDQTIGSLEVGKDADVAIVSLDHIAQKPVANVAAALVFSSNARDVKLTIVKGSEVFRAR